MELPINFHTFREAVFVVNRDRRKVSNLLWSIFFCSAGLGLSLAVIFSCRSSQTSALNLFSVRTLPLMQNIFANFIANDTTLAQIVADALPDEYLLGITGLCRSWEVFNLVECLPAFPQNSDILTTVLEDLNSSFSSDDERALVLWVYSTYDTKQSLWTILGIASSVLLITSIIWMSSVAIYIWFLPQRFNLSMVLIILNMVLALGVASIWTGMVVDQASTFKSQLAPAQDLSYATSLGPGFYLLWGFAACTLLITPGVALFVLVTLAFILEICLILAAVFSFFLLVVFMAMGQAE